MNTNVTEDDEEFSLSIPQSTFENTTHKLEPLWSRFQDFLSSIKEFNRSRSLLYKDLCQFYPIEEGTYGDSILPRLAEYEKQEEETFSPLVTAYETALKQSKVTYERHINGLRHRIKRAEQLYEDYQRAKEAWNRAREKSPTIAQEKLKKRNEELVEADSAYREYRHTLFEDISILQEQRFDYIDDIVNSLIKIQFHYDTNVANEEKVQFMLAVEQQNDAKSQANNIFDSGDSKTSTVGLHSILDNFWGRKYFRKYLLQEHSEENLDFWIEIETFKSLKPENDISQRAKEIWKIYLEPGSSKNVNMSGKNFGTVQEMISKSQFNINMFDGCQREIFDLMKSDSLDRFLKSTVYEQLKMRLRAKPLVHNALSYLPSAPSLPTSPFPHPVRRSYSISEGTRRPDSIAESPLIKLGAVKNDPNTFVSIRPSIRMDEVQSALATSQHVVASPPKKLDISFSKMTFGVKKKEKVDQLEQASNTKLLEEETKKAVENAVKSLIDSTGGLRLSKFPALEDDKLSTSGGKPSTTTQPTTTDDTENQVADGTTSSESKRDQMVKSQFRRSQSSIFPKTEVNEAIHNQQLEEVPVQRVRAATTKDAHDDLLQKQSVRELRALFQQHGIGINPNQNNNSSNNNRPPRPSRSGMDSGSNSSSQSSTGRENQLMQPPPKLSSLSPTKSNEKVTTEPVSTHVFIDRKSNTLSIDLSTTNPRQALVLFEFKGVDENELSLNVGDSITVLEYDHADWWLGMKDGKLGYFPCSFVKFINKDQIDESTVWPFRAKVLFDYIKHSDSELSIKQGEIVQIKVVTKNEWWLGRNRKGEVGYFPSNYVKLNY